MTTPAPVGTCSGCGMRDGAHAHWCVALLPRRDDAARDLPASLLPFTARVRRIVRYTSWAVVLLGVGLAASVTGEWLRRGDLHALERRVERLERAEQHREAR